ncbi:hypothetical protein LZ554_001257 [Drepanopeziza brunnea f. sp. 'monogermtubi']|nr:hypothetical protein LZ554_001257 [Drepanopeziza brunnea f. sp. 'monogermtubi']
MLLSQSTICSILLTWSLLFSRAQGTAPGKEIIGYRTVSEDEFYYLEENSRPFRNPEFDVAARISNQLGQGYTLINVPAGWRAKKGEAYCAFEANSAKMNAATKVWIPESYEEIGWDPEVKERRALWAGTEEEISDYLLSMVDNPQKALRFSYVQENPDQLLMVIPTETINANELDILAYCWKTEYGLKKYMNAQPVKWANWDILGDPRQEGLR